MWQRRGLVRFGERPWSGLSSLPCYVPHFVDPLSIPTSFLCGLCCCIIVSPPFTEVARVQRLAGLYSVLHLQLNCWLPNPAVALQWLKPSLGAVKSLRLFVKLAMPTLKIEKQHATAYRRLQTKALWLMVVHWQGSLDVCETVDKGNDIAHL